MGTGRALSRTELQRAAHRCRARQRGHPADLRRIAAVLMKRHLLLVFAVLIAISSLTLGAQRQRFFPDDPIWREPITQDVKNAVRYEPDLAYQTIENLFWRPGDKELGQRAKNINTVDE